MTNRCKLSLMDALHACWGAVFNSYFFCENEVERLLLKREMLNLEQTPGWVISIEDNGDWLLGVA